MEKVIVVGALSPRVEMAKEALDLLAELWPKPSFSTVMIETHQWYRLRRLLLAIPEELLDGDI